MEEKIVFVLALHGNTLAITKNLEKHLVVRPKNISFALAM